MFNFIKEKFKKIYSSFTEKAISLFSRDTIDESFLKELEILLISSDVGVATTNKIMEQLKQDLKKQKIKTVAEIKVELENQLLLHLKEHSNSQETPKVLLLVGINGSGKTTFASKFAHQLKEEGKKVLLVAGDTFRAAATEQLTQWAKKINVDVFAGKENQDPASLIFDACGKFVEEKYDHIIIDTAGRLQTKVNLMKELEKIKKIINKKLPNEQINSWLVIDAMLGQNSFQQAKIFHESTNIDGIILTKLDGTGKGGIIFSITKEFKLPILYISFGEKLEDVKSFNPEEYVKNLFGE
ncbi:TPA: signal recognition particle-docking protein FtsY [Candidatus Dependentiae bacterium]|nr:MAG: Signal recognition particle-docking protein FtsY [candidate division TM6 bacterium GW2011_GWE2_31_21]KKP53196.1 MAG: Signal recognition particle-docking protein FtsY [candidate division TM6 bacterium GW2011_GWF2_33_332]HBS48014.1 signal recognition particle-docking protein FtsY [Candidatus Dependentiae bacterium]HBZ73382.1 signal recognition particle-docking protein FtsY [Candidatus Dependentiae bacterium]